MDWVVTRYANKYKICYDNKNNNERFNVDYNPQIGKWIKYFTDKGFGKGAAYLGAVLSLYGKKWTIGKNL